MKKLLIILGLIMLTVCEKQQPTWQIIDCTSCYEEVKIYAEGTFQKQKEYPFNVTIFVTCKEIFAFNKPCYQEEIDKVGLHDATLYIKKVETIEKWCDCK